MRSTSTPSVPELYLPDTEAKPEKYAPYLQLVQKHWKKVVCYSIVWSWNMLFAAVILFGIIPNIAIELWRAAWAGFVPWGFLANVMILITLPFASMVAMLLWLRGKPSQQLQLFYGIQAPLFLLCLLRLFMVRVLTSGMAFLLGVLGVGMAALALHLREELREKSAGANALTKDSEAGQRFMLWLRWVGLCGLIMIGGYLALMLSFHCLPLLFVWLKTVFSFHWVGQFFRALTQPGHIIWVLLFAAPLFAFSFTILLGMPVGLVWIYSRAWKKTYKAFALLEGRTMARSVAAAVFLSVAWGGVHFNQQPQGQAFAMLAKPPKDIREQRSLLGRHKQLRTGLLNAYLSGYRYLSTSEASQLIAREYRNTFGLSKAAANDVQALYNRLASPMLYQGKGFREDSKKAEDLYAQFFDKPIQKAERKQIIHALSSTYMRRSVEAGVLKIGERKVLLLAQHLQVKEHGDWADIELHEVYQNKTPTQQEIFYYFSLPEGAVVTGLWLSDRGDSKARFKYVVAPRGAAQRVYKREVRRRVDPALLEKVGPRQYRLRAFPIPPQPRPRMRSRSPFSSPLRKAAPKFHLWMTIKVTGHKGHWPLPKLTQKRNLYWTGRTKLTINGKPVTRPRERWLQASIKGLQITPPQKHVIRFANGSQISATPYQLPQQLSLPSGKRFAIVLDRSYSMRSYREEVTKLFGWLASDVFPHNKVDLYLTSSPSRGDRPLRLEDVKQFNTNTIVYFGGHRLGGMLEQFAKLREARRYDSVFMITDGHSYDIKKTTKKPIATGAPLWMIHVGGRMAHAYEDATLATIQKSGGGSSTNLKQLLYRMAAQATLPQEGLLQLAGGYVWRFVPGLAQAPKTPAAPTPPVAPAKPLVPQHSTPDTKASIPPPQPKARRPRKVAKKLPPPTDGFGSIAASQRIVAAIRQREISKLGVLDQIHQMAVRHSIVSAYSSMIVLVNKRQRDALKRESARKDRFKRTAESGKAQLNMPSNPLAVTGTPEPHEWLLIILVLLGLGAHMRKQKGGWQDANQGCAG